MANTDTHHATNSVEFHLKILINFIKGQFTSQIKLKCYWLHEMVPIQWYEIEKKKYFIFISIFRIVPFQFPLDSLKEKILYFQCHILFDSSESFCFIGRISSSSTVQHSRCGVLCRRLSQFNFEMTFDTTAFSRIFYFKCDKRINR